MSELFAYTGISKQNFHQRVSRIDQKKGELAQLEVLMYQIRDDHPGLGGKKMYQMLQPHFIGRDQFFEFYSSLGFGVQAPKNFRRTTNSSGVIRFPNMVEGLELKKANQVWVSDITYYELEKRFYYLTFVMDLFSRMIVGYSASKRLLTEDTTIPAVQMALYGLPTTDKPILHSDGGGQYYSKKFLELTRNRLINSMAEDVYQNPFAERINGTIKNEYLKHWSPTTYQELQRDLTKAVYNYNTTRPHMGLEGNTPMSQHLVNTGIKE